MASLSSYDFYPDLRDMSPPRAIAETVMQNPCVNLISLPEAYELARKQPGVSETDRLIYPPIAEKMGLPKGARVLNDCHGKIIGRTAKARRFYNRITAIEKRKVEGDLREAMFQLEHHTLIKGEAVIGLDPDLMIKATFVTTTSDANNMFNWFSNFACLDLIKEEYESSQRLPVQDIIIVGFNEWTNDDPYYHNVGAPQLALVDEQHNVIFNLGMRYFGERKKGTLTLAWTSGMRLGMAACHGGIKEIDFAACSSQHRQLGKRSIAFFGLSGTGKSSHTNSPDNGGTLPKGFKKVALHDDAFQIDTAEKVCRVWEPSLFDKTDSRDLDHSDWKYLIALMNHGLIKVGDKLLPLGQDIRQGNGRALFDRDLLGAWVNKCSFPTALAWLMTDTILPPIIKFNDKYLAVAMGTALITKRTRAENVTEEELRKLVFEPFANPFRVYELHKDVDSFIKVLETGADCYCFNSAGYWRSSDTDLVDIPLQTSLTIQTAILMDRIKWEDWDLLPGAMIPEQQSIDILLPGFYDKYHPDKRENRDAYMKLMKDRFQQRREFIQASDLRARPILLQKLDNALQVKVR